MVPPRWGQRPEGGRGGTPSRTRSTAHVPCPRRRRTPAEPLPWVRSPSPPRKPPTTPPPAPTARATPPDPPPRGRRPRPPEKPTTTRPPAPGGGLGVVFEGDWD